jgi:thiol-disulfide isomerase/thioredoxin
MAMARKILLAAIVVMAIGAGIVPFAADLQPNAGGELPALTRAPVWLNSPQLQAAELRGKVVLVEFWTYSCINWLRTLPYVRTWAAKYKDQGLVVIGVHSPEFDFEKDVENVRRAARGLRVDYPVAIDSDHAIWRAFGNNYWPALYFIDAQGKLRHQHFGEGEYEQSERMLQKLLAEAGHANVSRDLVFPGGMGAEAAADWKNLKSPENYLGERTANFAALGTAPARLALNHWTLAGDWKRQKQSVALNKANGRIAYRFHARDLHLVMGPATRGTTARFRVFIDGKPPGVAHGTDVDAQGNGTATGQRLYQLIRQPGPVAERLFEIEFLDSGVEAFAFTFG